MMNRFMKIAVEEAVRGVRAEKGGPFGAVVAKKGRIIAKAHNSVLSSNDPTSHAEVNAIRAASKELKSFDLSGCELYTSCEPCPMCLAACYWARIGKIYYGCTSEDAQTAGFDDKQFYDLINSKVKKGRIPMKNIDRKECLKLFELWKAKKDKIRY